MKLIMIICIAACVVMTACDESTVALQPQKTQVIEPQYLTQQTWIVKQSDPVHTVQPLENAMKFVFKTDQSFRVLDSRFMHKYYGNWEFNPDTSAIVMHYNFAGEGLTDSTDTLEILELTSNVLKVKYNDPPSFVGIDNLPTLELEPAEEGEVYFTIKGNIPNASSLPDNVRPVIVWHVKGEDTFRTLGAGSINRGTNSFELSFKDYDFGYIDSFKPKIALGVGYILLSAVDDPLRFITVDNNTSPDFVRRTIDTSKIIGGVSDKAILMYRIMALDPPSNFFNALGGIPIKPNTGISWVDTIFSNELFPTGVRIVQDNGGNGLEMDPSGNVRSSGTLQMSVGSINDLNLPEWEW